ncbi:hypothetical protein Tco_0859356 [Tanacetum coccineum]|uniref:Reverse transcriptase domain-containing protein n=1 Tax=Tanacetum coccineum TaxID=301880 RepID=A0ABQ5BFP4_9ASTR
MPPKHEQFERSRKLLIEVDVLFGISKVILRAAAPMHRESKQGYTRKEEHGWKNYQTYCKPTKQRPRQVTERHHSAWHMVEAVIPAEIGSPTRRTIQGSDKENEEALRLNLNLLEERREIAEIKEARRKQQVEKYYNQRVHHKQFKVGEFVLRKNELSKVENTGKLGPKWEGPYEVVETYGTGAYKLRSMEGAEIPRTSHSSNLQKYHMHNASNDSLPPVEITRKNKGEKGKHMNSPEGRRKHKAFPPVRKLSDE